MGRKREEQAGAGRLKEVEGCLAPLYIMPRWVRVWNRDERAGVGRLQEVGVLLDWRREEQASAGRL